ncbi:MAG: hypothetical protein PHS62_01965 [Patescibacteria group bacterium]|nr:hypothetical protein [Patescibacteria group bacterium]
MDFLIKYKKIFVAAALALAVIIIGYLLYAVFFKPSQPQVNLENPAATTTAGRGNLPLTQTGAGQPVQLGQGQGGLTTGTGETTPASATARGGLTEVTALNQAASLGAALAANGDDLLYYNGQEGKFYRVTKDGKITLLSDTVFHNVEKITWSPDRTKAILEYPDQAKIIYDFKNNKQITLPSHWQDFAFSPDGSKIVMKSLAESADNRWLAVVNSQGTEAKKIAPLGDNDETVYPSWSPNNQTVAMYTEGATFNEQNVFFVGLNNENFKALKIAGRGFEFAWSPQGDRLLYSVYTSDNGLKPELWIANAQGDSIGSGRTNLELQTWADKCTFSGSNLYCAVPQELAEGAGLSKELAQNTKDNLYQIDVRTGAKKLVAVPDGGYTMSDLIVSDDGGYLYFTDQNTGKINQIKLK